MLIAILVGFVAGAYLALCAAVLYAVIAAFAMVTMRLVTGKW